jgi:hypothetical protein
MFTRGIMSRRIARSVFFPWLALVVTITILGAGFAGGIERALANNLIGWLFVLSPVPLAIWWLVTEFQAGSIR